MIVVKEKDLPQPAAGQNAPLGQKTRTTGESVFFSSLQTRTASRQNTSCYDRTVSERSVYNYFRDYDPNTGRYIEADPIGLEGGINIYAYAAQNPLTLTDVLGLAPYNDPMNQIANRAAGMRSNANVPPDLRDKGPFGPVCGSGPTASWIPDGVWSNACQKHDKCYSTCGSDRLQCDMDFLINSWGNLTYFLAVRRFGEAAFRDAQEKCSCEQAKCKDAR